MKVSEELIKGLNDQQKEAVLTVDGAVQVNAGAGSGKTAVLTRRTAHMILDCGIDPSEILLTTFTKKATSEMEERLAKLIPSKAIKAMTLKSSHAIGYSILAKELYNINHPLAEAFRNPKDAVLMGLNEKKFLDSVVSSIEKDRTIEYEIRAMVKEKGLRSLKSVIGRCKNEGLDPYEYEQSLGNATNVKVLAYLEFYKRYEILKEQAKKIDFDDMIFLTARLFREYPEILRKYQQKWKYFLIDEGQDNNILQYEIFEKLTKPENNIFLVGDDDQAMYSFRGAKPEEFISFQERFPEAKIIKLEINYRCDREILEKANTLIVNNEERLEKTLQFHKDSGEQSVFYHHYSDESDEAINIIAEIKHIVENENVSMKKVAILYRTNAQSRAFEDELIMAGLPYVIHGGFSFYERAEIKDLISYLKLAHDINDNNSFERIYKVPLRGLGQAFLEKVKAVKGKSYFENMSYIKTKTQYEQKGIEELAFIINRLHKMSRDEESTLQDMVDFIVDSKGGRYADHLKSQLGDANDSEEGESAEDFTKSPKYENIVQLKYLMQNFKSLTEFVEYVDKMLGKQKLSVDGIQLMTIHRSKGLEFDSVFNVGWNEGLLPHFRSLEAYEEGKKNAIEEERRLGYVGITRAERTCYISSTEVYNGKPQLTSRFVNEMGLVPENDEYPQFDEEMVAYDNLEL
jgi:DNA helicase-2/ATP-dependent DNA helicase PcrA